MTKDEAMEIMELLYIAYPNFNKNNMKNFNKVWISRLMEGDYQKTLRKTKLYTAENKFLPSLADVVHIENQPRDDGMAEQIRAAEESVKKENQDPEVLKRKQQMLEDMREKLGRKKANE